MDVRDFVRSVHDARANGIIGLCRFILRGFFFFFSFDVEMRQYQKMKWIARKCEMGSEMRSFFARSVCVPRSLPVAIYQVCAQHCFRFFFLRIQILFFVVCPNVIEKIRYVGATDSFRALGTWSCKLHKRLIMWRDFLPSFFAARCAPTSQRRIKWHKIGEQIGIWWLAPLWLSFISFLRRVSFMGCHGCFVYQLNVRAFAFNLMCQIGQK